MSDLSTTINRGEIYYAQMPIYTTERPNSCEHGYRPCVVVSSDVGNRTSKVLLVCPITTKLKKLSCNVNIEWTKNEKASQVLCNHIMAMPVEALSECRGKVTDEELQEINVGIIKSLGINKLVLKGTIAEVMQQLHELIEKYGEKATIKEVIENESKC